MRGSGGAILEAGEAEIVRSVLGAAFPRVAAEGVLPDVDSRTSAAAGEKTVEGSGLDEGTGAGQAGQEGRSALRLCNLVAQSPSASERRVQAGGREGTDGAGNRTVGNYLLQTVSEPDASY